MTYAEGSAPSPAPWVPDKWIILPTYAPEPTIGIRHLASLSTWQLLLIPLMEPQQIWPLPRVEYLDNMKLDGLQSAVALLLPRGSPGCVEALLLPSTRLEFCALDAMKTCLVAKATIRPGECWGPNLFFLVLPLPLGGHLDKIFC